MERSQRKKFPADPMAYQLLEEIGDGVSATVHRALCIPFNEIVAIKVLDLEKCNSDMDGIWREVKTMTLIDHLNVLRAHCSFTSDHSLWVVMPYMAGGSCLHIMKSAYSEGFEEPVIATLLREVLKALVYLHGQGYIHRDIKAGNILIDTNGAVKLADFGVSACMFDNGDRKHSWNTFVGTPCWMAPEVMQQLHGYDFKADIWSFGITALELAHGHAPFSKYPPMKVLLMTLQNAPPCLDYERDRRFSKSFKAMIGACLVKDPLRRPSAQKLLKHNFFRHGRSNEYLARTILDGLVPLGERFRILKAKDADLFRQNKSSNEDMDNLSQQQYVRGVSSWNFDIEDLKAQAALGDEIADFSPREDADNNKSKKLFTDDNHEWDASHQGAVDNTHPSETQDLFQDSDGSLASFPERPLQTLKGCFDICDDDTSTSSTEWQDAVLSRFELQQHSASHMQDSDPRCHVDVERNRLAKGTSPELQNFSSGSLSPEQVFSPHGNALGHSNRSGLQHKNIPEGIQNGPLLPGKIQETNPQALVATHEANFDGKVIQCKGRFKVTSADAGPKGPSTSHLSRNSRNRASPTTSSILPLLKFMLQQNSMQRDEVVELIRFAEQMLAMEHQSNSIGFGNGDASQFCSVSKREREMLSLANQLQQRLSNLVDEIQSVKLQNAQLQGQLVALSCKGPEKLLKDEEAPQQ